MENCQIFISYRRRGGNHLARLIETVLKSLGYEVFLDVESMRAGKFNEQIYRAIEASDDVLVILSEHALDRCVDPEDFVRKEVEYALELHKNVIPVMDPDFVFPDTLPEKMVPLKDHHGIVTDSNYFNAVIQGIEGLLISKPQRGKGYRQFLKLGLYPQALAACESMIMEDPMNADACYCAAIALLRGKQPFLLDRATIQKAEQYLNVAIAGDNLAVYHYMMAYLKLDYYSRKMLRTLPDYTFHLEQARAMQLKEEEIYELFALLRVARPEEM
jgi:hypothetical protein